MMIKVIGVCVSSSLELVIPGSLATEVNKQLVGLIEINK